MSTEKSTTQCPAGYPTANIHQKIAKEDEREVDLASQDGNEDMNPDDESTDRSIHARFTSGFPFYPGHRPGPMGRYPEAYDHHSYRPKYGRPTPPSGYGGPGYSAHHDEGHPLAFAHDDGGYGRPPQGVYGAAQYAVHSYEAPPPPRRRPPLYTENFYQRNDHYGH